MTEKDSHTYKHKSPPDTAQGGFGFIPNGIREKNIFFYHPDHLGSSSYITGNDGKVSQHTEYIAFGEILFDEHSSEHTMPYLFNGKELDSETGLYYYGARYYDPRVSLWLNVDPLAEKYPHVSPYTYTLNNPIKFIDPDGRDIVLPKGTSVKNTYIILGNLQKLTDDKLVYSTQKDGTIRIKIASLGKGNKTAGTRLIRRLNSSDKVTTIEIGNKGNSARANSKTASGKTDWTKAMNGTGDDATVSFNPSSDPLIKTVEPKTGNISGKKRPNQIGLAHELIHADHINNGSVDFTKTEHTYQTVGGNMTQTHPIEEFRTVGLKGTKKGDITENQIRKEQSQNQRGAY